MKNMLVAAAAAIVVAAPAAAQTAPSINVVTWVAPNVYSGDPSVDAYTTWQGNALAALKTGTVTPTGTPNTPGYAFQQSDIFRSDMIATGGVSWKGSADPGATYGPQYANEQGSRPYFGLIVNGNGTKVSLADLSLSTTSNDSVNYFGFDFAAGSFKFSQKLQGVNAGADGVLFTGDDEYITDPNSTALVDGLIGVGYGSADDPCSGTPFQGQCDTTAGRQNAIDNDLQALYGSTDPNDRIAWGNRYSGTYSLNGVSATGTFNVAPGVPEPATWGTMILGFGLIGGALRRRSAKVAVA